MTPEFYPIPNVMALALHNLIRGRRLPLTGVVVSLTMGALLPLRGEAEPREWWGAATFGAEPHYHWLDEAPARGGEAGPPVFDAAGRLWLGQGDLYRFDGYRWDRWEAEVETVLGLVDEERLIVQQGPFFGFHTLDASGRPREAEPQWIQDDFPPEVARGTAWFVRAFEGEPGLFWVLNGDIWHWEEGKATPLLAQPGDSIVFPIEWDGRWHYSLGDGIVWEMRADGARRSLTLPDPELTPRWIRGSRDHSPGGLELAGPAARLRLDEEAAICWHDPTLGRLTAEGWFVGASTAPTGWTVALSHLRGFAVYPAGGGPALRLPSPARPGEDWRENPIGQHAFDGLGNLWFDTGQGLFRWENPGRTWRWMADKTGFHGVRATTDGLLLQAWSGLQRLDFSRGESIRLADGEEIFFDALELRSGRIVGASREQLVRFTPEGKRATPVGDDLLELCAIGDDPEHFLAFGHHHVYLARFSAAAGEDTVPLLDLPGRIVDTVADGLSFDYLLADGALHRLRLTPEEKGGYRLAEVRELLPADGRHADARLLAWEDRRLLLRGGGAFLWGEGGEIQPLKAVSMLDVQQATRMEGGRILLAARPPRGDGLVFAVLPGQPRSDAPAEFFFYPGSLELTDLEVLHWEPRHEQIFLGSTEQLFSVAFASLLPFAELPPAHLEYSRDGGANWARLDGAVPALPYGDSGLRFRWFNEDWYAHPPVAFESRVAGLGGDWISTDRAERELTGLREGRYRFETRMLDPAGQVRQELAFAFRILPPWYRSNWAYAAYAALLLAAIYASFRLYSYRERIRRDYLEMVVRKRTAELEAANAVKTEFVANMSHELRNPMNGVVGLTELLERSPLDDEPKRLVRTLRACSEQLSRMISDVLDFAKIEAGRLSLDKRPFNAPAMVEKAVEVVSWDAAQTAHQIHQESEGHAPFLVLGDDAKISQILINFLSNACKYAEPGPILLRSTYRPGMRNRLQLRFEVIDRGPGLTSEEQARVFERFYRSPRAANSAVRGSGLGLAVCGEIAELMGATIGVESNAHGGSTFFFEVALPLPEGAEHVHQPLDYDSSYMGTVLVVDDLDYNRLVAAGILESLGFTVTSVAEGGEAIACLLAADYDFAFIDYELPDTTGPEILRTVQGEKPAFRTKCFAVTAYAGEEKRRECLEAGFLGFVSKPISRLRLREALIASGLDAGDLRSGAYQQPLSDPLEQTYDLEPLLVLAGGSRARLMDKCDGYLDVLRTEVDATLVLIDQRPPDAGALAKQLHRLTSHASIVKARPFIAAVDHLRQQVKHGAPDTWRRAAEGVEEAARELAINLRRVVDEYRSRA